MAATVGAGDDMCAICRSSRYLNPEMRFLVNPECYHKMCESCVDRIFSVGPAPCPYKGCGKILRKSRFKEQLFDDIGVEREVDVRKRVCRVFNRRRDNFESDGAFDDYLERMEDMIWAIVEGGAEAEAAESALVDYEKENRKEILQNALNQREEDEYSAEVARMEAERKRKLTLLAVELQEKETAVVQECEAEMLRALEQGKKPSQTLVEENRRRVDERISELREAYAEKLAKPAIVPRRTANTGPAKPATPFTPFAGDRQPLTGWTLQTRYYDPSMERAGDPAVAAGGFNERACEGDFITLAYMSLDVDVQAEKGAAPVAVS